MNQTKEYAQSKILDRHLVGDENYLSTVKKDARLQAARVIVQNTKLGRNYVVRREESLLAPGDNHEGWVLDSRLYISSLQERPLYVAVEEREVLDRHIRDGLAREGDLLSENSRLQDENQRLKSAADSQITAIRIFSLICLVMLFLLVLVAAT